MKMALKFSPPPALLSLESLLCCLVCVVCGFVRILGLCLCVWDVGRAPGREPGIH